MSEVSPHSSSKKRKKKGMFNYILHAVDKVFYQVYDGEPVHTKKGSGADAILEEEVLFCKNNVVIKIIRSDSNEKEDEEISGYMNIKKIYKSDCVYTDLMLSWVPNSFMSASTTEESEVMFPPVPNEPINPNNQHSKYTLDTFNYQLQATNDLADGNEEELPDVTVPRNFDSPLGNVFSVNLIDMKTVKLFYSSITDMDAGQFVIGSHENEYKVFHFRNGGLNKIADIFDSWNGCLVDEDLIPEEVGQKVYYVNKKATCRKENSTSPVEEGRYRALSMNNWMVFVNQLGQLEDSFNFRKHVFFGGLSHEIRPDAWKFLLYYYPMHSTRRERECLRDEKIKAYEAIHKKRLSLSGKEYEEFWRNVQFIVDKDVVRTDRSHPYYAGQDNPNVQKMRNILLNYAVYDASTGYTQGMSDLVAPVLAILHDEVDSFWCFAGLMGSSTFATTPTDDSMDKSLGFLRELLRLMAPDFYMHCLCVDEDLNLLFAHRWLVLCFKREFIFHEVLKIWEACWARYQTDYFQIFICVAMVTLYGEICLEKKMDSVEILQYFTEMATKFDGSAVLKEARSLLHKFRQLNRIPCSLRGLLSGKGVWDGGISPDIECVTHHRRCCQEFRKKDSTTDLRHMNETKKDDVMDKNDAIDKNDVTQNEEKHASGLEDNTTINEEQNMQDVCHSSVQNRSEDNDANVREVLSNNTQSSSCIEKDDLPEKLSLLSLPQNNTGSSSSTIDQAKSALETPYGLPSTASESLPTITTPTEDEAEQSVHLERIYENLENV